MRLSLSSFCICLPLLCSGVSSYGQELIDPKASAPARALYSNLFRTMRAGKTLFGHQDDLAYGVGWKAAGKIRSDVHAVCGDFPAVYGWDLGKLEKGASENLDSVPFDSMQQWMMEAYRRGGLITISWHMDNYRTGGSAWDTTPSVTDILPGMPMHAAFKEDLDRFADFVGALKSGRGRKAAPIPILFRPFHELTGDWFWWCKGSTKRDEFIALWQFTVHYLRDVKKLHNLIYVWNSADNFDSEQALMEYYPGDEWVDVISFDDYGDVKDAAGRLRLQKRLQILQAAALRHHKLPALAETGYERIPDPDWWTTVLLESLKPNGAGNSLAYVLVWRNANAKHHYAPYPGHASAADFVRFYRDPATLFEADLPDMYKMPSKN